MLQAFFHAWERRLASVTKDRVVRPFEWGLDWIPENGPKPGALPADGMRPARTLTVTLVSTAVNRAAQRFLAASDGDHSITVSQFHSLVTYA